jgi:hypothetical protein
LLEREKRQTERGTVVVVCAAREGRSETESVFLLLPLSQGGEGSGVAGASREAPPPRFISSSHTIITILHPLPISSFPLLSLPIDCPYTDREILERKKIKTKIFVYRSSVRINAACSRFASLSCFLPVQDPMPGASLVHSVPICSFQVVLCWFVRRGEILAVRSDSACPSGAESALRFPQVS